MSGNGLIRSLTLLAVVAALASQARGDSMAEAREHYKKGAAAYETGEFRRAIDEFKASYALYPSPMLLYNLAQSYRKAGDGELALHEYKQYLAKTLDGTPDGRFRADAREQQLRLEKAIDEQARAKVGPASGTVEPEHPVSVSPPNPAPIAVAPPPTPATPAIVDAPTPRPSRKPIYKQWWLWTTVGLVAVGVGVGLGVGLSQSSTTYPTANLPQGTFRW